MLTDGTAALAPLDGGPGDEMAGYKGYGYATVVEILSSALAGGEFMKALTGVSPVELLRNTRLDAARQLLAEGKGSVAEVASLVGFADASYFTRCYKAYFGTTPHEMNKQKY